MINNKTDIIGYMQLFFKFWPIGSPDEAYYMEYKGDFSKPLSNTFSVHLEKSARNRTKRSAYSKENILIMKHMLLNVLQMPKISIQKRQALELVCCQEKNL